ncbi:hypothetical protein ACK38W_21085, partial [Aeromonas veronii]
VLNIAPRLPLKLRGAKCLDLQGANLVCGLGFWLQANQKDYFFTVIDNLNTSFSYPKWVNDEITRAKTIVTNVRQYEKDEMPVTAENEIQKLFRL